MRKLFLLISFSGAWSLSAQEITIINNFPDARAVEQPGEYVLKKVTQHTYIVNEYEPSQSSAREQVMQLISFSLRGYTDNLYLNARNVVIASEPGTAFDKSAAAIVRNALWIHDYPFHDEFLGFSGEVKSLAQQLYSLSGYRVTTERGNGISVGAKSVELYVFQRMVYDLKVTMEREARAFFDRYIAPAIGGSETQSQSTSPQLEHYDIGLEPIPHIETALADLKPVLPVDYGSPVRTRRDRRRRSDAPDFSEKMIALMEENNRILQNYGTRFDNLQNQIDAERGQRNEGIEIVREEVRALREIVKSAVVGATPDGSGPGAAGAMQVELVFERNSAELSPSHIAMLNRIEISLRSSTALQASITGFADRTGNPDLNARLSQQRAQAVQAYLLSRGIEPQRLAVTFVGDSASMSANPADRKVEVRLQ